MGRLIGNAGNDHVGLGIIHQGVARVNFVLANQNVSYSPNFTSHNDPLIQEFYWQERSRKQHFCQSVLGSIESVMEQLGIKVPVYRELVNHATDFAIVRVLRLKRKKLSIADIAKSIGDVKEYEVRRRLQELRRKRIVSVSKISGGRKYTDSRNADVFMRCKLESGSRRSKSSR